MGKADVEEGASKGRRNRSWGNSLCM